METFEYQELLDWANNRKSQWLRQRAKSSPSKIEVSVSESEVTDDWIASWYNPPETNSKLLNNLSNKTEIIKLNKEQKTDNNSELVSNSHLPSEGLDRYEEDNIKEKIISISKKDSSLNSSSLLATTKLPKGENANCQVETEQIENTGQDILSNNQFVLVKDSKILANILEPLQESKIIAIDTETTGLDPLLSKIRLIQLAIPEKPVIIIDLFKIDSNELEPLKKILAGKAIKVFQNAKFDLKFLTLLGWEVKGQLFDTMLASQLLTAGLSSSGHNLAELVKVYLGEELPKEQQLSDWSLSKLSLQQLEYAARDAAILLRLRDVFKSLLKKANLVEVAKLEFDCLRAIVEMELKGMLLDLSRWDSLRQDLEIAKSKAAQKLKSYLEIGTSGQLNLLGEESINLDSQPQVLKALQGLNVPIKDTSKHSLIPLVQDYPVVKALLEYRSCAKFVQAFTSSLPKYIHPVTGRIHPNYQQLGAATGRTSCRNPNLQQIPRDKSFRSCFIAAPGYKLVVADYSQIELRVAAEISRDRRMINAYQHDEDLHLLTASLVTGKAMEKVTKEERQAAKAVNFGLIFAMSAAGLADYARESYGVEMSLKEAATFRQRFFKYYQGIADWHESLRKSDQREIRTLSDRLRQWQEQPKLTELYNTPVQGTAADIVKKALALLPERLLGKGAKIIGTVHDEILLEVPDLLCQEVCGILSQTMERAGEYYLRLVSVKTEVVVVDNWGGK
jgi:DNA polymerase I-like protein with 3'-5' exonuclease and polymerase domains